MHALPSFVLLATATLMAGCLNQIIPQIDNGNGGDMAVKTAAGTPLQDLAFVYSPDPTTDGGVAVHFAQIQAQFDSLGCTTSMCHGGTQQPVLTATPTADTVLRANYFNLIDGCATGTPDPADCVDTHNAASSLLLAKTCATSGVDHAGGKPFPDDSAPMYQLWQAWIAADAPY
jgi:hypothetical protein